MFNLSSSSVLIEAMPSSVAELLACPSCRGALNESSTALACSGCHRVYPLHDGTPNLLPARPFAPSINTFGFVSRGFQSAAAAPFVYDVVQQLAGARRILRRIEPMLEGAAGVLVLDVGGGTGSLEALLPASARYLWLDSDPKKLRGFRAKSQSPAMLADATSLPLRSRSVDWAVSVGVSHHLSDGQLGRMLDELRRVATKLFFLDAVLTPRRISRLLWHYDQGRYPRTAGELRSEIGARFDVERDEEFTIYHRYLLVTAS
jgi:uncharacterized protein YbaR (Trm112 family)